MMNYPLLLTNFMERAAKYYSRKEIVSVYADDIFRYTYGDWYRRICQLAHALRSLGIRHGDRVASFSLNNHRHFELYFGVPAYGAVLHTINVRLSQDHIVHIISHAQDRIMFVDEDVWFLLEPVKDRLKTVEYFIIMSQKETVMPAAMSPVLSYDRLIAEFPDSYEFPKNRDENEPAVLCYTSATTGDPKGIMYSHRGLVLHSMVTASALGGLERDCVLHVVPMFHANAWGAPFTCTMLCMKQVLPGRHILDMERLCRIIETEKVTFTCGVPTIWMMLFNYLEKGANHDFSSLRALYSGGSAMPRQIMAAFKEKYGIEMAQGYGSTETSPIVSLSTPNSYYADSPFEEQLKCRATAGILLPGLELKIIRADGKEIVPDGKEIGEICLRGPWIAGEYYMDKERSAAGFQDGWFHIGDMATINKDGYITLVDRAKDLIKSAGEWISSVDLENIIMEHPDVLEAAVIAIPHPKWLEKPCACVVPMPGRENRLTPEDISDFLAARVVKWWLPEKIVFLKEIPKTSVGKFSKRELRRIVFPMLEIETPSVDVQQ